MTNFRGWLAMQAYAPTTRKLYAGVRARAVAAGQDTPQKAAEALAEVAGTLPLGSVSMQWCAIRAWAVCESVDPATLTKPKNKRKQAGGREALLPKALERYTTDLTALERQHATAGNATPYRVLLLLPLTGLRIEEACTLKRKDVQQRGAHWGLRVVGKGSKERWVPLNVDARRILNRALIQHRDTATPYVFPAASNPKRAIPQDTVRKTLLALRRSWPRDMQAVSPHSLRHSFLTMLLKRGVDLKKIQTIAGHANIATTSGYLHPDAEDLAAAVALLESPPPHKG